MVASEQERRWAKTVAVLLAVPAIRSAVACSCMDIGDTPSEVAKFITGPDFWTEFIFIGRVLDEISYSTSPEYYYDGAEPYEFTFQNVTFSLEEILFNRAVDGSLPPNVLVEDDGTMTVTTSTETSCCVCGKGGFTVDGARHLISLSGGMDLNVCDINCRITKGSECADIAGALRSAAPTEIRAYCLTEKDCKEASKGYSSFKSGVFTTATKGCFSKKNIAYFSTGNLEEMTTTDLPKMQERIWCDNAVEGGAPGSPSPPGGDDVACLAEEDCKAVSSSMGFAKFTSGKYTTKGCFAKKDKAYFSRGSEGDMSKSDLPGVQERIWCTYKDACLTAETCRAKSVALGLGFKEDTYPTKGCFSKKNTVYFSAGTKEEMAVADLPGVQVRLQCGDELSAAVVAKQVAESPAGSNEASILSQLGNGVLSSGSAMRTTWNHNFAVIAVTVMVHVIL